MTEPRVMVVFAGVFAENGYEFFDADTLSASPKFALEKSREVLGVMKCTGWEFKRVCKVRVTIEEAR